MAESAPATTGTFAMSESLVNAHRFARFLALGFGVDQATQLTHAGWTDLVECRDGVNRPATSPLYPGRVAAALARGCSHAQAVAIFT